MKKFLAVAVILLFIGLAFAPSINANVSKEALVEFTTEVCGLNGGKQSVKLTQEEAEEVDELFDSIRQRLNATDTRDEAEVVFKDAVVELDKYGLLGGLSIKQAQRLVVDPYKNLNKLKSFDKIKNDNLNISKRNYFCLVAGQTIHTYCVHRTNVWLLPALGIMLTLLTGIGLGLLVLLSAILPEDLMQDIERLGFNLWLGCVFSSLLIWTTLGQRTHWNPISLFNIFGIGVYTELGDVIYYSEGWVNSFGILGIKKWEGEVLGNLPGAKIIYFPIPLMYLYPAIWAFNGIKISYDIDGSVKFYMGSALAVGLDQKDDN